MNLLAKHSTLPSKFRYRYSANDGFKNVSEELWHLGL